MPDHDFRLSNGRGERDIKSKSLAAESSHENAKFCVVFGRTFLQISEKTTGLDVDNIAVLEIVLCEGQKSTTEAWVLHLHL